MFICLVNVDRFFGIDWFDDERFVKLILKLFFEFVWFDDIMVLSLIFALIEVVLSEILVNDCELGGGLGNGLFMCGGLLDSVLQTG